LEEKNINNLANSVLGAYNNESLHLTTYPFEIKENVIKLINCFSSNKDKFKFLMHLFLVTKTFIDIDINEYYENTMIYQEICKRINRSLVDMIFHTKEKNLYKAFNNKDLKKIFSLRKPDISRYVKYKFSKKLLFMMPFLDYYCFVIEKGEYFYAPSAKETDDICSKLNFIRVLIKTFIRRNFKIINLENKLKEVRDSIKESVELKNLLLDEYGAHVSYDEYFYLKNSTFTSFFRENNVDTPTCFNKTNSMKRSVNEKHLIKFNNYVMRNGKRAAT
jgi:hypothetical protein